MFDLKKSISSFILLALYSFSLMAQTTTSKNSVSIVRKETANNDNSSGDNKTYYQRNNSGVMVKHTPEGIIYKSHLRDFDEIQVTLLNRDGKMLYEYANPLKRNIDYLISLNEIPSGEYVLRFEYGSRLVICNILVSG